MNLFGFMQKAFERNALKQIKTTKIEIQCLLDSKKSVSNRILKLADDLDDMEMNESKLRYDIYFSKELLKEQKFIFYTRTGRFPD